MVTIIILVYIILSAAGLLGIILSYNGSIFNKIAASILFGWIVFPIIFMIIIGEVLGDYIKKYS